MFQAYQLRSDYFGNLSKVGSVVDYLFVIVECQFLLHICILVGVMFRRFVFCKVKFYIFGYFNCSFSCK